MPRTRSNGAALGGGAPHARAMLVGAAWLGLGLGLGAGLGSGLGPGPGLKLGPGPELGLVVGLGLGAAGKRHLIAPGVGVAAAVLLE